MGKKFLIFKLLGRIINALCGHMAFFVFKGPVYTQATFADTLGLLHAAHETCGTVGHTGVG